MKLLVFTVFSLLVAILGAATAHTFASAGDLDAEMPVSVVAAESAVAADAFDVSLLAVDSEIDAERPRARAAPARPAARKAGVARKAGRAVKRVARKAGRAVKRAGRAVKRAGRKILRKLGKGKKGRKVARKGGKKARKAGRKGVRKAGRKIGRKGSKKGVRKGRKAGKKGARKGRKAGKKGARKGRKAGKKGARKGRKAGKKGARKAGKKGRKGARKAGRRSANSGLRTKNTPRASGSNDAAHKASVVAMQSEIRDLKQAIVNLRQDSRNALKGGFGPVGRLSHIPEANLVNGYEKKQDHAALYATAVPKETRPVTKADDFYSVNLGTDAKSLSKLTRTMAAKDDISLVF